MVVVSLLLPEIAVVPRSLRVGQKYTNIQCFKLVGSMHILFYGVFI